MKKFLATTGVALLMLTPAAAYAADNTPEIKAEVTKATSSSRQTSSEVNVGGALACYLAWRAGRFGNDHI